MDPTGPIGTLISLVARVVGGRLNVKFWADTQNQMIAHIGVPIYARHGVIRVHNGGSRRFTLNEAGWEARDGTRVVAHIAHDKKTLEPGGPEVTATGAPEDLLRAHDKSATLVRMYVHLAGEEKARFRKLPSGWIERVRELRKQDAAES